MVGRSAVERALSTVNDPELDQSITSLGFVAAVEIDGGAVRVALRLPTAFCSPNFAYLMASDALDAIRGVDGVATAVVELVDHSDSAVINAGLASGGGFAATFPEESSSELDALRRKFQAKAHLAAIERVCGELLATGEWTLGDLVELVIADLPQTRSVQALLRRRADLGLSDRSGEFVLVDETGVRWAAPSLALQLRHARSTRISMEGNAHFCQGLLRTRYDLPTPTSRRATA